ncbi:PKD domain protein [Owenweeksia hongkongensis DSM 17368]|uniref:PKD domain protein n=1 Tax=Owenweeksia hongkongensis (strain DSM 17368 / CIP 108786 / JCM 12287 / NRRL B-23963 / UST20020801) TaxID=926562 RepID=G8R4S5_OWEHD|nr:T9SS type A sorting domain-containing protein [Owenweeksia hongkongensis]AEV33199.1 PKD domain protein [Owenweeksia hongkongensis DSM 17368]
MRTTLLFILSLFVIGASAQLNGTYTVGSAPSDFATLNDARDSIYFGGTSGPVTLLIKPGAYTTPMMWGSINPADTITIESQSGDTSNTSLVFSMIYECENIKIKNLKLIPVTNTNTVYTDKGSAIERCKNIIIDSCLIVGKLQRYHNIGFTISDCYGGLQISNNTFQRLKMGVVFSAYSYYNSKYHMGTKVISGNHFINIETALKFGGYFTDTTIIAHNRIDGGEVGIQMYYVSNSNRLELRSGLMLIDGNLITNPSIKAIFLDFMVLNAGNVVLRNNMLSGGYEHNHTFSTPGQSFVVSYVRTLEINATENVDLYNNSIWGGLVFANLGANTRIKNNAFYSDKQTIILYDIIPYIFENNSFFTPHGSDSIGFSTSNQQYLHFSDFSIYKYHVWKNPNFISQTDLHACSDALVGAGRNTGTLFDFDGESRSVTSPDIGADEFKNSNIAPCAFYAQTCTDSSSTLTFTDSSPRSTSSFWKFSDGTSYTSKSFSKTFSGQGTHTFKLISSNSYGRDSLESTVDFSSVVQQTISVQQNQVSIDTGYFYYQWYRDTIAISGATKYFYQASTPGHYGVQYENEFGCLVWAKNTPFLTQPELSLTQPRNIQLYPNPASSVVNLSSKDKSIKNVEVIDLYGKTLSHTELNAKTGLITVEDLPKGIYIFRVWLKDQNYPHDLKVEIL